VTRIPLGAGPEFDRIRAAAAALGDSAGALGDDCASIPDAEGTVVLSTDASVENVHFRRAWLSAEEIGWRAASAALSDLAAQGAAPVGLLAAVALPRETPEAESTAVMRGIGRAAAAVGATVLGGDLSAAGEWMITVTVVGRAVHPVSRRGAAAGDPASLFGLALMYHNGLGVTANLQQAAKWYRMAASRGHARAKFMLGVMHYQGHGVEKDLIEAYKWFALAQAALPPGPDRDRSIKAANLIEASLPQEELEAARASAQNWASGD